MQKERTDLWMEIKKGVRKEIPANTGRKRLNLSGAIDVITHKIVIHEDKTLNAEATIRFFQKIEKAYPSKGTVHVFCDNAPYYRNKTIKQYLETSKVVLHFLQPYSPNLYTNNLKNWEFDKADARSLIQQSSAKAAQLE